MKTISQAITGNEEITEPLSPYAVLVEFYSAFNNQRFEKMRANWLQSDEVSMSNPLGGIKRGWDEIEQVYQKIFTGKARVYVEFYDYSIHTSKDMFLAAGRERGWLKVNGRKTELAIRTTRIYILQNEQWKQMHHHGSMDNPELLANYQKTLL